MDDDHLEHGVTSRQPIPYRALYQGLALQLLLLGIERILHHLVSGGGQLA